MEKFLFWLVWLTFLRRLKDGCLQALSARAGSLDQTTRDLIAAGNSHRSRPKQVRTDRRNCPLTPTTDYPQAPDETARMDENRSHPARPVGPARSDVETSP